MMKGKSMAGKGKMAMATYQKGGKVMPAKGAAKAAAKPMKGYRKGGMVKGC